MPVADEGQKQDQDRDQKEAGCFHRVDVMPRVLRVQGRLLGDRHTSIVERVGKSHGATLRRSCMTGQPTNDGGNLVRFALFEVDLAAGELRKAGAKIRLQEQPFQLLAYLLERPGQVVTREELREKLWAADTFVDFDHSLNTAVNKVREALGDSATSPRFIETLARRGYRFIAPIDRPASNASHEHAPPAAQEEPLHPELNIPIPRREVPRLLFALIQVMYLIFYVVTLFHFPGVQRVSDGFLPGWSALTIQILVLVSAGVGIALRLYLLSCVGFDHRGLGRNFRRLFPAVLVLDLLWATAPFLLMEKIGIGAAFAATAALLYVPFAERSLVSMAYPDMPR